MSKGDLEGRTYSRVQFHIEKKNLSMPQNRESRKVHISYRNFINGEDGTE
jgi:hypothetical protein